MNLTPYVKNLYWELPNLKKYESPWEIINDLDQIIKYLLSNLPYHEYKIKNRIAIHKSAIIENNVTLKENTIIGENSIIKSGAYLRDGVYIGKGVNIGANSEIKQSIIFNKSRIAHLNYVGNSIIGEDVNLEAGSILANHFNEFKNKKIQVLVDNKIIQTNVTKFGSLIGDESRIGANSVLNPGTILKRNAVIGRLTHIDQLLEYTSKNNF